MYILHCLATHCMMIKFIITLNILLLTLQCYCQVSIITPKPHQIQWHDAELGAILHYDLHVFDGIRYGQGNNRIIPFADYNIFNPPNLNTYQWLQAAKATGSTVS